LPGYESRHNTKYWSGAPYYGFGCSSHSFNGRLKRWSNQRDVEAYTRSIEMGESPVVERVNLTEHDARAEAVFLGLRLMRGLSAAKYQKSFGVDLLDVHSDEWSRFREAGLIEFDGDLIKLTRSGALLSNEVFAAFV